MKFCVSVMLDVTSIDPTFNVEAVAESPENAKRLAESVRQAIEHAVRYGYAEGFVHTFDAVVAIEPTYFTVCW